MSQFCSRRDPSTTAAATHGHVRAARERAGWRRYARSRGVAGVAQIVVLAAKQGWVAAAGVASRAGRLPPLTADDD